MEGQQGPEYIREAAVIPGQAIITPFSPGQDIGAGAVGIVGIETFVAGRINFTADKAIVMLPGLKVIQAVNHLKDAPGV
jgi:hypothetical protein